ncbi:zinc-ribbon domain-containing protein [Halapricum hydrolyticum]|uniref:Zinc-ribbon domain-containing protein n=1 Tax=Halapricum hydrolyticum TaxID=2979991 RepID=A0AAE3LEL7_9EURY|nr:zinc-ribbon domain-containing protein [Halapricum hydrolyticum]MCU4718390.1 zinc-ribbon domain-containing protein [Halapricum hydrolyticum]MCU4726497.1 zinc-ribbon domain-containing protein [Halapricum hydrolyticum]
MVPYCPSCGEELAEDASFCSNCGAEIEDASSSTEEFEAQSGSIEPDDDVEGWKQYLPQSWRIGITGVVFGLLIGFLVAWALAEIGGSGIGFLIGLIGGTLYLWQKRTATGAIGSGLYVSALIMILVPILFYGGMLANVDEDPQTAEEVGMAIGGVMGLVIWGFVFFLLAIVVAAIGYFFKKREKKKLNAA